MMTVLKAAAFDRKDRKMGVFVTGTLLVGLLWSAVIGTVSAASPMRRPGSPNSGEPATVVKMTNSLKFSPDTVVIQQGETVKWENVSLLVHTVTADPEEARTDESVKLPEGAKSFDSGNMDPDETFTHTFSKPGTYKYFCVPHEAMMKGVVIVKPE